MRFNYTLSDKQVMVAPNTLEKLENEPGSHRNGLITRLQPRNSLENRVH